MKKIWMKREMVGKVERSLGLVILAAGEKYTDDTLAWSDKTEEEIQAEQQN